jgi:hypothetical protein
MADTTTKTAQTAASAARDTVDQATEAGNEGVRRAQRAANQGVEFGTQTMNAYVEAGKTASAAMGDVNRAITDAYSRSLADYNALSQRALSVKSLQDVVELQASALQQMQNNLATMADIYGQFINGLTRTFEPMVSRASDAASQVTQAARQATPRGA